MTPPMYHISPQVFAILGTAISALVVGGGIYLLGLADVVYPLTFVQVNTPHPPSHSPPPQIA